MGRFFILPPRRFLESEGNTVKELEKQYDPARVEDRIYQSWMDGG